MTHRKAKRYGVPLLFLIIFAINSPAKAGNVPRSECESQPAGTIFCEDFESINWRTNKGWAGSKINDPVYITAPINSGPTQDSSNHVLQFNPPAGSAGVNLYVDFTPANKVWVRWYTKYNVGWNFSDRNHGPFLSSGNTDDNFHSGYRPDGVNGHGTFSLEYWPQNGRFFTYSYYHGMYQQCSNPLGGCFGDSFPCVYDSDGPAYFCERPEDRPPGGMASIPGPVAGQWYCIEQYMDIGDPVSDTQAASGLANGEYKLLIDGKLIANPKNLHFRTSALFKPASEFLFQVYFHDSANHNTAGQMFDNLVISTQQVGCAASPVVKPLAPTNVMVE